MVLTSVLQVVGPSCALILAPTVFGKLHDQIKIYAGYFRFPAVIALVVARLLVFQDFSLSGPSAPIFTVYAAVALLSMMILEMLEDVVVIRQIIPMSSWVHFWQFEFDMFAFTKKKLV